MNVLMRNENYPPPRATPTPGGRIRASTVVESDNPAALLHFRCLDHCTMLEDETFRRNTIYLRLILRDPDDDEMIFDDRRRAFAAATN